MTQENKAGKIIALVVFASLASIGTILFVIATILPQSMFGYPWTPLAPVILLMLAFLFGVFATPFLLYVKNRTVMMKRVEDFAQRDNDILKSPRSLFYELLSTLGAVIIVSSITLCIYWFTHWFSVGQHKTSIYYGSAAMLVIGLWGNRTEKFTIMLTRAVSLPLIVGGMAIGLFYSFQENGGPFEATEIIVWLVPAMYVWLSMVNFIFKDGAHETLVPSTGTHSVLLLWQVSEIILLKTRRNMAANQSFAILFVLLIFVFPDYVEKITPQNLVDMFTGFWTALGDLPFTKEHASYIALGFFVAMSCTDIASEMPNILPENLMLFGGIYNALFSTSVTVMLLFLIAPLFVVLFIVGYAFLGPDLAIVVGFFTFPAWSQRLVAIITAAFVLSFDHAKPH